MAPQDSMQRTVGKSRDHRRVRDRPRWVKRVVVALFAFAGLGLLVFSWMPKPIFVDVASVERGAMRVTVDEDGRSRVKDRHVVSAPLSGNLARIEHHPGDPVGEGDIVARIVPIASPLLDERSRQTAQASLLAAQAARRQARSQVDRTASALSFAKTEAERLRGLLAEGVVSQRELDQAELEVRTLSADLASARFGEKVALHQLEMAEAALGHLKSSRDASQQMLVTSPIAGRVLKVIQESEGVVQAGAPLIELGDPAALEVVVDILTSDAVLVQPGAFASLERWGGEPLKGRVRVVEPSAFTRISSLGVEEQRVNVVVDLESPRPAWQALGDGYRVEARIVVWEEADVVSVPASAVFRSEGNWAVFRVERDTARLQLIEVGRRNGARVQIVGGLTESDRVIVHPSDRITDGVRITSR